MKPMTAKELRGKSIKELVNLRKEMKKKLFEMRMKNTLRALKETHLIRVAKRNIARINTVLKQKLTQGK